MNGADDDGTLGVKFDALAQLGDVLIEGPAVGHVIQSPTLIEEHIPRDDDASVFAR